MTCVAKLVESLARREIPCDAIPLELVKLIEKFSEEFDFSKHNNFFQNEIVGYSCQTECGQDLVVLCRVYRSKCSRILLKVETDLQISNCIDNDCEGKKFIKVKKQFWTKLPDGKLRNPKTAFTQMSSPLFQFHLGHRVLPHFRKEFEKKESKFFGDLNKKSCLCTPIY